MEVAQGSNLGHDTGGCLSASAQGRGRGRSVKDLEVGAVDELLVGVSVVRTKTRGENHPLEFSYGFQALHLIMTNNNSIFRLSSRH